MERLSAEGHFFHRECFRCDVCATSLRLASYAFDSDEGKLRAKAWCVVLAQAPVPLVGLGHPTLPIEQGVSRAAVRRAGAPLVRLPSMGRHS